MTYLKSTLRAITLLQYDRCVELLTKGELFRSPHPMPPGLFGRRKRSFPSLAVSWVSRLLAGEVTIGSPGRLVALNLLGKSTAREVTSGSPGKLMALNLTRAEQLHVASAARRLRQAVAVQYGSAGGQRGA